MNIHPRTQPVNKFKNDLASFILERMKEFELTPSELFWVLTKELNSWANMCIRSEWEESE